MMLRQAHIGDRFCFEGVFSVQRANSHGVINFVFLEVFSMCLVFSIEAAGLFVFYVYIFFSQVMRQRNSFK